MSPDPDIIIIGGGLEGLSTALAQTIQVAIDIRN
jgi:hypothetical protein